MAVPITVPRLGWNMDQGVFVGWLKADGAMVRAGEPLFTLESEKATQDIECLDDGILHIPPDGPQKGDVVSVGTIIGFLLQQDEPIPTVSKPSPSPQQAEPMPTQTRARMLETSTRHHPASSPRARRIAAELGIDWRKAKPSGRTGRIRERDVLALNATLAKEPIAPIASLRRVIAERMVASHRSTAPVTLTTTTDATELVNLRNQWKTAASCNKPVPTYTDLLVKLTALALEKHPVLNSHWEEDRIVTPEEIHIGIAVDTDAGLVVPVV